MSSWGAAVVALAIVLALLALVWCLVNTLITRDIREASDQVSDDSDAAVRAVAVMREQLVDLRAVLRQLQAADRDVASVEQGPRGKHAAR